MSSISTCTVARGFHCAALGAILLCLLWTGRARPQDEGDAIVPELIKLLKNKDARFRAAAAHALACRAAEEVTSNAAGEVSEAIIQAVPSLIACLEDEDKEVRSGAAMALGNIGRPAKAAIPTLIKAVKKGNPISAAHALGKMGSDSEEIVKTLIGALKTAPDETQNTQWLVYDAKPFIVEDTLRSLAAYSLGEIGPAAKPAVPLLIDILKEDKYESARGFAAFALGKIDPADKDHIPHLDRALRDKSGFVRAHASNSLVAFGSPAVPSLNKALADSDWRVRKAAADALGRIGPDAKAAVPALTRLLVIDNRIDVHPDLRLSAVKALGGIGPLAKGAIPFLAYYLAADGEFPKEAAEALVKIGPASVTLLSKSLRANDPNLRKLAADSLAKLGPSAKTAVPALIYLLRDKSLAVRTSAIEALGSIGPGAKAAIPSLKALSRAKDPETRKAAAAALEKIH